MPRTHYRSNIRVRVREDITGDTIDIFIVKYGTNGNKAVLQTRGDDDPSQRLFWTEVAEGQVYPSPTFRIGRQDWGLFELFRSMTEEHKAQDKDAELDAMRRHLMDMRSLLFQALGADDPQAPLIVKNTVSYEDMEILAKTTGKLIIPDNVLTRLDTVDG
jgi:hypothetical protein